MNLSFHSYWKLMATYLASQWLGVLILFLLILGSIVLQLLQPEFIRNFIDTATTGGSLRTLTTLAVWFLLIGVLQQIVSILAAYTGEQVGWAATNHLRSDLLAHCLRLDPGFYQTHNPGELIERVDGDVNLLANFFTQFSLQVLGNSFLLAGVLFALFRVDWRIGLALSIYSAIVLGWLYRVRALAAPFWEKARQASAELFGFLEERLAAVEDLCANGARNYSVQGLGPFQEAMLTRSRKAALMENISFSMTAALSVLAQVIGLGLGAFLFMQGQISLGTIVLITTYIGLLDTPLSTLRDQIADLQRANACIPRIEALRATPITIQDGAGAIWTAGPIEVTFDHVSFRYGSEGAGLEEISFCLHPGKTLGLLGRTGSGKTTIARLLLRQYDPSAGSIQINGVDLREYCLTDFRKQVGIVTQEVTVFPATLRDNLTWFDPGFSDETLVSMVRDLGWWEWFDTLPQGLDTRLGTGGRGLSAGEAQLLALARIFLHNPRLVILDEASARLDPLTERLIDQALGRLLTGRTCIIIAHRLQTLLRADELMILENGGILEYGSRENLVKDPLSQFSQLNNTGWEAA